MMSSAITSGQSATDCMAINQVQREDWGQVVSCSRKLSPVKRQPISILHNRGNGAIRSAHRPDIERWD